MIKKTPKQGNIIARAAIMHKGGVHEKTRSAKRQRAKRKLRSKINAYMVTRNSDHFSFMSLEF
jgi:hypothetical protein